ncbi:uncharacterized protein LOC122725274 [Manihot esculenta]|uniref:uncharacterized protein LOC122725274 n=1 Tax=Manihot esculenta TaxID=3983 RepID=UPI001CC57B1D|nr:uncharacterized protein LOC122725274 [Manihot esculenta]
MAAYDRAGNPREHVLNYKAFMELQTLSDALMYKVFPTTLTGPARAWFNSLEVGSIRSFGDLAIAFISRFIAGVPVDRKTSYLETVRQRGDESLREYVARFNTEALQIPELDEGRVVEALQKGTTSLEFAKGVEDRGKAPEERRSERHEKKQSKKPEPYRQPWDRRDQRPFPPRVPEQKPFPPRILENLTPLNASRAEVLMAVQDKEFLQWPRPMRAEANQRDPNKYCQYHRTHGHDTNNCYQLISEIERLIKRGHLWNFVKKLEGERPQLNPTVERPRRVGAGPVNDGSSGTINMIVEGTGDRMSRRGKKRGRDGESSSAEVMQGLPADGNPYGAIGSGLGPSQRDRRSPSACGGESKADSYSRRSAKDPHSLCDVLSSQTPPKLQRDIGKTCTI